MAKRIPSIRTATSSTDGAPRPDGHSGACSGRHASGVYPSVSNPQSRTSAATLDLDAYLAWVAGRPISLRPMEQRLLSLLGQSPNRIVRTEDLIVALYGNIPIEAGRVRLKRLVADIRGRLGADFARGLRTVCKIGLVLLDDDSIGMNELQTASSCQGPRKSARS